ncbi:ABC transporter substrate binding protein [Photobacterium sp. 1_MG-2023]|uniref:ABC transporter substrate binding protein n=1 Tax=Photobacterium sp. 1_MG-2023 TaxID=3062646 RepID=UPI0026E159B1|nr:ABC transporter substrate binding protein [Photobacterium sp. 1_MG-2023]MDO6708271.1 ABC transporter substrate binding protein [Photobacterium sp. 1_MG-2023]
MRLVLLLLVLLMPRLALAEANVLVIHSYHQGMRWTDAQQAGLSDAVRASQIHLQIDYMDSKRYQSPWYLHQLVDLYKAKLGNENFDAIVVTDDNALWLVNQLAAYIGETPVLMSGVNQYRPEKHSNLSRVGGIFEANDVSANINLVQTIQPDVQHFYFISDHTTTGREIWQDTQDYLSQHPELPYTLLSPQTFTELFDSVSQLPPKSAIVFLSYFMDGNGTYLSSREVMKHLSNRANAPVYASYRFLLDSGALGGVVSRGYDQGLMLGQLLKQVLNGAVSEFPAFLTSPRQVMFNYPALKRWKVQVDQSQVLLVNQPVSWLERYSGHVRLISMVLAAMLVVIMLLIVIIRRLRRSERKLTQSRTLFEGVFDQSFQFIAILNQGGQLKSANLAMQDLLGRSVIKYDCPFWEWGCWERASTQQLRQSFLSASHTQLVRFETGINSSEDGVRILDISIKPLPQTEGEECQLLLEARDVTARHHMEEKLREREISYRLLYEQQPVILLAINQHGRIQSVNQFATELLGYSKREMLGHKVTDFYLDDVEIPQHFISTHQGKEEQSVWRRQLRYTCASGKAVWIRETIRSSLSQHQLLLVGEDITSTRELEAKLEYQANHDYLTNLFNRSYFERQLDTSLNEAREKSARHAMLYLDLDQFKVINDTAGHEAGDEALKQVAWLLRGIMPHKATLARLGGDEFAIILNHCEVEGALRLGAEILHLLEESEFYWQNTRFSLSASIGIRLIDDTAGSPQQVHAQADTACYAAKDEGRNRLHLYRPDDEELQRREREMAYVSHIRRALDEQRFELYAQTIAPLASRAKGHHYEVLLRMRSSDGAMIPPGLFMPAAERYNLAHLIDRYVVNAVLDWLEVHPEAVAPLQLCSVNLSGQSMGNPDFVDFLLTRIGRSSIPASKLCLEITETAAIGNMSEAIELFTQLKSLGCMISLDDFGAGLSSFGYLKRLPVDLIKIDGMFVRDIADDEVDMAMVTAINDLAKKMGKQTVAEFVENDAILSRLEQLGVDYAQGYRFGKPMPLPALVAHLNQTTADIW